MKKYIILLVITSLCVFPRVALALSNDFKFDSSKLSFVFNNKKNAVVKTFNSKYKLSYSIKDNDSKFERDIRNLTQKTTYLLLGSVNNQKESSDNYYKRHEDYLKMASYKYFPRNKNFKSGYDESNPLYRYVTAAELAIPQLFNKFNELGIIYNSYGDIRISKSGDLVISTLSLPNVSMKEENKDNGKYNIVKTNLIMYYYFIKINNTYRLTYLYGETTDNVSKYFNKLEDTELSNTKAIVSSYESDSTGIYNFDKLKAVTTDDINNIYNSNIKNVVYLSSHYNNMIVANANGIFINDGIVLTTWSFMEKSLMKAQYFTIGDSDGNLYDIDGIVTVDPGLDIAVVKIKQKNGNYVKLGDKVDIEDPVITLNSKSGVGLTVQKGIVLVNDNYLETSIPLKENDQGSPLFNKNGYLVGLNTSKVIDSNLSIAIKLNAIKQIQTKFNNIDFNSINFITFDNLKKQYYYTKYHKENIINNIPKNKWNEYRKIGKVESKIKLKLVKSSYKDGIISLRYKNNIVNYVSSMQLSSGFKEQLIKDGYTQEMNGLTRCIYKNNKYKVVIIDEFDYLIIVMVKL